MRLIIFRQVGICSLQSLVWCNFNVYTRYLLWRACMQDAFAQARTQPKGIGKARARR